VEDLWVTLFEVLAAADLRVLELVEYCDCVFAERFVEGLEEVFGVF